MPRVRVKFCGMTSQGDAMAAAYLGVDAIGLIFHPESPRAVTIDQAIHIVSILPPFVAKIGVFVDRSPQFVQSVLEALALDSLQFHGGESADYCRSFNKPYIKTIHVGSNDFNSSIVETYSDAQGILFDTYNADLPGGSGAVFPWDQVPALNKPIILAGGLTASNIVNAIEQVKPYAVDVTSGIEAQKGIKDLNKMALFMAAVMDYSNRS